MTPASNNLSFRTAASVFQIERICTCLTEAGRQECRLRIGCSLEIMFKSPGFSSTSFIVITNLSNERRVHQLSGRRLYHLEFPQARVAMPQRSLRSSQVNDCKSKFDDIASVQGIMLAWMLFGRSNPVESDVVRLL